MLAVRLSKQIEDRLERLAKKTGRTKTYYAREAILKYIDELEDVYLADKIYEHVRAGREKTIPLAKVIKEFGLES